MLKHKYRARKLIIFSFIFILCLTVLVRIFFLQIIQKEKLVKRAERQHNFKKNLMPTRGGIFDTNGVSLAVSLSLYTLKVIPSEVKDAVFLSSSLSRILNIDKNLIQKKIKSSKKCVYLKRKISEKKYKEIYELKLSGVHFDREFKRIYPKDSLACHVLGFVGMDDIGLEGIEKYYDKELSGLKGYRNIVKDAKSLELIGIADKKIDQQDGYDVYLTIDETIQYITEREAGAVYEKYKPLSVSAIVIEPKTGYILALANFPNYNLNKPIKDFDLVRNKIISDCYEPGSTFKIVGIAGALNEGIVNKDDKFFCENGEYKVQGRKKLLHDHTPHGWLTVKEVVQKSSNIGTVKIVMKLGREKLFDYIKKFGFGENSGIDLDGEIRGIVRNPSSWTDSSMSAIPMGQELGVTPLQIVFSMGAIANNGVLMRPKLVKELRNSKGVVVRRFEPEPIRRVLNVKTAGIMNEILESVVSSDGTASSAGIKGARVAGKTGTAQKFDFKNRVYSERKHIASFVGFAPVDDPKICVIVLIDEPPYSQRYGGVVAAPVFKKIAEEVLFYLDKK
mgnify:CR=1 FL=1